MQQPTFVLDVDIVGTCNLRCPSCPVGNAPELRTRSGIMAPEMLGAILDKAMGECLVTYVGLFNWTEPFLHPRLPEMVRTVRSRGLPCSLSSNLNVTCDFQEVLRADPTSIRISLSGFRQETYGKTHRRGNIERVKQNMQQLADAKRATESKTDLHVLFHRYVGNHEDESEMRKFAEGIGFRFGPVWAYLMPLEKNLAVLGEPGTGTSVTDADRELIDSLALRPEEASRLAQPYKHQKCVLQTERLAIDHEGKVQLCCATYDRSQYTIADFVTTPLAEIQRLRQENSMCTTCAKHGLHVVGVYGAPEFERAAMNRVHSVFPGLELAPSLTAPPAPKPAPTKKRRKTLIQKLFGRLIRRSAA
jgi:pyruvate-formate lyase-activating enzyme